MVISMDSIKNLILAKRSHQVKNHLVVVAVLATRLKADLRTSVGSNLGVVGGLFSPYFFELVHANSLLANT